jgi:hypothetical protein
VKKLAILLLLVAAGCRRSQVVTPVTAANTPGAVTAREAVQKFMAAAKAQDLQAMSVIWGSKQGPVRDTRDKAEIEQREIIMMCYLKHDSYSVLGEAPAKDGDRVLAVEVKFKTLTRSTNFTATKGPSERWYVGSFDMDALRQICATR